MIHPRTHEAYEILVAGDGAGEVVLCCEHASKERHGDWAADAWMADTHWAWDSGAAWLTRSLAEIWGSRAALARFSRLLIDANRPLYSGTLFREEAEGRRVTLNQRLSDLERLERIRRWWTPYHDALDELCGAAPARVLLSMHSFTRQYGDAAPRSIEIGVLFENDEALAHRIRDGLAEITRRDVRPNEPYSGKGGMMYSCYRHARRHGLHAIELEVRQDLLADPVARQQILEAIATVVPAALGGTP